MSDHGILCNVIRDDCPTCGRWLSFCVTHEEPTQNNRCRCLDDPDVRAFLASDGPAMVEKASEKLKEREKQ